MKGLRQQIEFFWEIFSIKAVDWDCLNFSDLLSGVKAVIIGNLRWVCSDDKVAESRIYLLMFESFRVENTKDRVTMQLREIKFFVVFSILVDSVLDNFRVFVTYQIYQT